MAVPEPDRDEEFLAWVHYRQAEAIGDCCSLPELLFNDRDGELRTVVPIPFPSHERT
jgi:hypothetical protein